MHEEGDDIGLRSGEGTYPEVVIDVESKNEMENESVSANHWCRDCSEWMILPSRTHRHLRPRHHRLHPRETDDTEEVILYRMIQEDHQRQYHPPTTSDYVMIDTTGMNMHHAQYPRIHPFPRALALDPDRFHEDGIVQASAA